jgi:hypothetical protein
MSADDKDLKQLAKEVATIKNSLETVIPDKLNKMHERVKEVEKTAAAIKPFADLDARVGAVEDQGAFVTRLAAQHGDLAELLKALAARVSVMEEIITRTRTLLSSQLRCACGNNVPLKENGSPKYALEAPTCEACYFGRGGRP